MPPDSRKLRTRRRLFGLDRSGPDPVATRAGQPLRPITLPNLIGYIRLALIPVFLVVEFSSHDGRVAVGAVLFALIGWADYLDGFTARLTGQFSRMGALLDPVIDRCLVISGMVVVWHFSLLPRWAIVAVVVREVSMVLLTRYSLSRGVDIKINWAGRLAVAPTMGAPFCAIVGLHWLALILMYVGLALALSATFLYVIRGAKALKASSSD